MCSYHTTATVCLNCLINYQCVIILKLHLYCDISSCVEWTSFCNVYCKKKCISASHHEAPIFFLIWLLMQFQFMGSVSSRYHWLRSWFAAKCCLASLVSAGWKYYVVTLMNSLCLELFLFFFNLLILTNRMFRCLDQIPIPDCCWQVTWTLRGSSWWTATQSVWIGCVSATTAVRRWSWRRRRTLRPQSVCSVSSCRSSPSQLSRQRSRGTYCNYTKVCVHFCTFHSLCCSAVSSPFTVWFDFI